MIKLKNLIESSILNKSYNLYNNIVTQIKNNQVKYKFSKFNILENLIESLQITLKNNDLKIYFIGHDVPINNFFNIKEKYIVIKLQYPLSTLEIKNNYKKYIKNWIKLDYVRDVFIHEGTHIFDKINLKKYITPKKNYDDYINQKNEFKASSNSILNNIDKMTDKDIFYSTYINYSKKDYEELLTDEIQFMKFRYLTNKIQNIVNKYNMKINMKYIMYILYTLISNNTTNVEYIKKYTDENIKKLIELIKFKI